MSDLISRQQERQSVAQKYAFGNDEFSLEAAYHDCKLVFDGITDDDSFQEADTGLILYYANEIIYALHKALDVAIAALGKDTDVPATDDLISRQAAIDALGTPHGILYPIRTVEALPSAQTEQQWIPCSERYPDMDERVLVYTVAHDYHVWDCMSNRADNYFWEDEEGLYHDKYEADLWMPLPDPWRGEEDEPHKIDSMPTIEERKTGKWMELDFTEAWEYRCDQCGRRSDFKENFCPNCGADMRGE